MRPSTGLACLILCLAGTACSVNQPSGSPSPTASPADTARKASSSDVPCENVINFSDSPSKGRAIVLGAALPSANAGGPQLAAHPSEMPDGSIRYFAKDGLEVQRGRPLQISVPDEVRGRLWIGWGGNPSHPAQRISFNGCDGEKEWMAFAGGYWVTKPGCFPLEVTDGRAVKRIEIAIETEC